jgi:hypothetical protein
MKYINKFIVALLLIVTPIALYAGVRAYNTSGLLLGSFASVSCGTNISCSQSSGKLAIDVLAAPTGLLQNQVASTTTTITAAQCGSTFVSDSADVLTLPEASTVLGCRLTFVCGTADDFDINPADATDVIGITGSITGANTTTVLAPAAGDALRCTDIGAGFVLEAVGADLWAVLSTNGIITDVN